MKELMLKDSEDTCDSEVSLALLEVTATCGKGTLLRVGKDSEAGTIPAFPTGEGDL